MNIARSFAQLIVIAAACFASPAAAQPDQPSVVVRGMVSGSPASIRFTRDELEKMEMATIKTATEWNKGVITFEGVPMEALLTAAGVSGDTATVVALNDYSVDIPRSDFAEFGVILAIKRDGQYMPVDDQGPFFIIYPFDSNPALQVQPYVGRAVWQVKEIIVE